MVSISVDLDSGRDYEIEIGRGALDRIGVKLASLGDVSRVALTIDGNVERHYREQVCDAITDRGLDVDVYVIPPGESSKTIDYAYSLWDGFLTSGVDRRSVVVAFGGGVVGDLSGFVAATYMRGIRYVQIPTSLLAQVDSSVGGKTAIDLPSGKNMVGAFYQPRFVLIDPLVLRTLDDKQYRAGLGEIIKYGASLDSDLFETLENNVEKINARDPDVLEEIIARCCEIKARIVVEDERDLGGLRALLNYGHTFGHALESALGFGGAPHGFCVNIGSIWAAKLASRLRAKGNETFEAIDDEWIERQRRLSIDLGTPVSLKDVGRKIGDSDDLTIDRLIKIMANDKKTEFGKLRFVLPTGLGSSLLTNDVSVDEVREFLEEERRDEQN